VRMKFGIGVLAVLAVALPVVPSAFAVSGTDLAVVSVTASVSKARPGQPVTFSVFARDNGPVAAPMYVYVTNSLDFPMLTMRCALGVSPDTPWCEYHPVPVGQGLVTKVFVHAPPRTAGRTRFSVRVCVENGDGVADQIPANDCRSRTVKLVGH
jgi:hypothetical protein